MSETGEEIWRDVDRLLRTGFTAAGQLAENLRRRRAEADRRQRHAAIAEQQATKERLQAVQDEAREKYRKVGWTDWQEQASLTDWAEAYRYARAMRDNDPVAGAAHRRVEDEVRARYHVDIRTALDEYLLQTAEDQQTRAQPETAATQAAEAGTEKPRGVDETDVGPNAPTSDEKPAQAGAQQGTDQDRGPAAGAGNDTRPGSAQQGRAGTDRTAPTKDEWTVEDVLGDVKEQKVRDPHTRRGEDQVDVVTGEVVTGEVLTEDEFHQARRSAATAAMAFEADAETSVRETTGRTRRPRNPRQPNTERTRQRSGR